MRKTTFFSAVLSLFLLVPASIIWAQTITSQKGLTTAIFPTQYGNVKVYVPDDVRPGELISGSIIIEPAGKNAKQVEKSISEMKKYQLKIDNLNFEFEKYNLIPEKVFEFEWLVHLDRKSTCPIELMHVSGNKPHQLTYQFKLPSVDSGLQTPGCVIPSHALTGEPFRIPGTFDGDASNTKCNLNNSPLDILAESPRQCIVSYPADAGGLRTLTVNENNEEKCSRPVSGVNMQVSSGDLNLKKGQSTYIDVKITGLENLPDKAQLTISNITPNIVTITNGNLQVIPIWPLTDSAGGIFSIHCPAVSLTTGNFSVNINLDLPEISSSHSTVTPEVPPGYTKKSCECSASATITKNGNTFKAEAKGECKGQYGIGINTFPGCSVMSIAYEWSVSGGKENVELVGKTNTASVNVRPKNNGAFVVCVKVTVTCIDGTVCTTSICADQAGKKTEVPGTETKPPDTNPPVTGDPKRPPTTTENPPSKCSCNASCTIKTGAKKGNEISYTGEITAECKGTSGTGSTRVQCTVGPITYAWSIGPSGKDVAEIVGKADGPGVTVKLKKDGAYNLYLNGTVTCSDGTVCEFVCNVEIPLIPTITYPKACNPVLEEKVEPMINGGLKSKQIGLTNSSSLNRDEFIVLEAEGGDWDQLIFKCEPQKPDCPDSRSEITVPLIGRVRFEWKIDGDNKGTFVKLGCLPDEKSTEGERVIFKPPVIPLPVKTNDTTVITTITLSIIDDGSAVDDGKVDKTITIKTKRSKTSPDKYQVEISGGAGSGPSSPASKTTPGTCSTNGPNWKPKDDLTKPTVTLPAVADNNKMVLGQWIVLTTPNQTDNDVAEFICVSNANCATGPLEKAYPDKVDYTWEIVSGGGKLILGNTGRFVVYEAPLDMPKSKEVIEVKFRITAKNPAGKRKDPDKTQEEMLLKVYQPGVMLSHPPLDWLPKEDNSIELNSSLKYKEAGEWKDALAHMCRIHYFELLNVSEEKGISLNYPVPKDAKICRDLKLKKEGEHEAYDSSGADKCKGQGMFKQARTVRPEKEYSMIVYSLDYGSYGFFRSFANLSKGGKDSIKGEKPVYISIPAHEAHKLTHPQGRAKKNKYLDNRVTIPYDIDENKICDGGWMTQGGEKVNDPLNNNTDEDDEPDGDTFDGDGLATYEEYRGFKVMEKTVVAHIRTNHKVKDIFVRNRDDLDLSLYASVSELDLHEISEEQYVDDKLRWINPNFNKAMHIVDQRGLKLINAGNHGALLGIAESEGALEPTIPNFEKEIRVYKTRIEKACDDRKLPDCSAKLNAVVAHELLHGNNVCHHGEGDDTKEGSFDFTHGLRSGDVSCVMRYDNVGTVIRGFNPEAVGSALCTSATGTGYNANNQLFGNAKDKRGNCKGQIRISAKNGRPKSCGNR